MEKDRLKSLSVISGIALRIEGELTELKNWIKNQLELTGDDQNFPRIDSFCSVSGLGTEKDPLDTFRGDDGGGHHLSVSPGITIKEEEASTTNNRNHHQDSEDDDIQILPTTPAISNLEAVTVESSRPEEFILGDSYAFGGSSNPITMTSRAPRVAPTRKFIPIRPKPTVVATRKVHPHPGHVNKLRRIKNEVLEASSSSLRSLLIRNRVPNPEKPRNHICHVCSRSFIRSSHLSTHMEMHMNSGSPIICQFCSKSFKHKHNLSAHIGNVHRAEQDHLPYRCESEGCGKYFATEASLEHHKVEHEGISCSICGRVFFNRRGLRDHTQKVHLVCTFCGKQMLTKTGLLLHKRRNHSSIRHPYTEAIG